MPPSFDFTTRDLNSSVRRTMEGHCSEKHPKEKIWVLYNKIIEAPKTESDNATRCADKTLSVETLVGKVLITIEEQDKASTWVSMRHHMDPDMVRRKLSDMLCIARNFEHNGTMKSKSYMSFDAFPVRRKLRSHSLFFQAGYNLAKRRLIIREKASLRQNVDRLKRLSLSRRRGST